MAQAELQNQIERQQPDLQVNEAFQNQLHELQDNPRQAELLPVADKTPAREDIFQFLVKSKPEDMGPGLNQAREIVKQFQHEGNPVAAAPSYETKVEAAVKQSDKDFADAVASHKAELGMARMDVMFKGSTFMGKVQGLNANIKEIPEEKRQEVSTMINLMQKDTLSPALAAELRKEVGKYPEVLKSFDIAKAAEKELSVADQHMASLQEPMLKAASEQAATRFIQAEFKAISGDKGGAVILKQEAMEQFRQNQAQIVGKPIASKPPIQA